MSIAVSQTMQALCAVTQSLPIGTNLALLHFLWMQSYKGHGRRPKYGELVRPLARTRKGKCLPATPPDRVKTWKENGIEFRAEFWVNLVLPDDKVHPHNPIFNVIAVYDPRYQDPWLLACPLQLSGAASRGLYRDRWPVEQVPLAAKQMLGGARQFVFAPESCQRLPELNLLAGSIVTYLAATLPAVPTGFWDRNPKPTPGRLRRLLARPPFPKPTLCRSDFGKRTPFSITCPRVFWSIGVQDRPPAPENTAKCSNSTAFPCPAAVLALSG